MTDLTMWDVIRDSGDRFYNDQIAFEAFGREGVTLGRMTAPPGNGMAVINQLNWCLDCGRSNTEPHGGDHAFIPALQD